MRRQTHIPRPDWQAKVEDIGFIWHTAGGPYWDERSSYVFSREQIAEIESASAELYRLFLEAGQDIVERNLLSEFGIPDWAADLIRQTWDAEPPALNYGRFDLGYDGRSPPKLFEFNCDTPTSLFEASVVQWLWKEDVFPGADQFNSIHERLVTKWRELKPLLPSPLYFAHAEEDSGEDMLTTTYLRDTAREAGIDSEPILMSDIGWNDAGRCFTDLKEQPIRAVYKLYPWEWIVAEQFGRNIPNSEPTLWIEPIWKMMWSNKRILAYLWWRYPDHPNLLPAFDHPNGMTSYARKPCLSREGANIQIVRNGEEVERAEGSYGDGPVIYQALYDLPLTDGGYPVIGSWIIDGEPAGMGIREAGLVTGNLARFIPHIIRD